MWSCHPTASCGLPVNRAFGGAISGAAGGAAGGGFAAALTGGNFWDGAWQGATSGAIAGGVSAGAMAAANGAPLFKGSRLLNERGSLDFNGKAPHVKGDIGEDIGYAEAISRGETDLGTQICGTVDGIRIRIDHATMKDAIHPEFDYEVHIYEYKNQQVLKPTSNQRIAFPKLESGSSIKFYGPRSNRVFKYLGPKTIMYLHIINYGSVQFYHYKYQIKFKY